MVYAYTPNFVSIGLFCSLPVAKKQILPLLTLAFCGVASWQQSEKIQRVHNYKPSPIQQYQKCFCTSTPSWQNFAHKL